MIKHKVHEKDEQHKPIRTLSAVLLMLLTLTMAGCISNNEEPITPQTNVNSNANSAGEANAPLAVNATETPEPMPMVSAQERKINLPIIYIEAPLNYLKNRDDVTVNVFYTGGNPLIKGELIIHDKEFVELADFNVPVMLITLLTKDGSYMETRNLLGRGGEYSFVLGKNLSVSAEELEENYALAVDIHGH